MRSVLYALAGLALLAGVSCAAAGTPQPQLPTQPLTIDTAHGPVRFVVEVASNGQQQREGLMWRTAMAPDAGMLFDFHRPQQVSFWMKNTVLPLDMVFIRENGTISSIAANTTPMSETPVPSAEPVRAVLEINAGRAAALGIEPDETVHGAIFAMRGD